MAKVEYQIVGRYMSGTEVTGYHLHSIETGKSAKYTRDQVIFLVGRGQITNCSGQIYQDKVLLRGVGMSLEELPIQREDGTTKNIVETGKIRKNATPQDLMTHYMVTKAIQFGRNTIGYIIENASGEHKVSREQLYKLVKDGNIGNMRYQESNGKPILRGVGINLNDLPTITAEEAGIKVPATANTPVKSVATSTTPKKTPATRKLLPYEEKFKANVTEVAKIIENQSGGRVKCDVWTIDEERVRFDYYINGKTEKGGFIEIVDMGDGIVSGYLCVVDRDGDTGNAWSFEPKTVSKQEIASAFKWAIGKHKEFGDI